MRKALPLLCLLCSLLGMDRGAIFAQALATSKQICTPAMLDVTALPTPPSFTYGGHLFVLELQNISPTACLLTYPQVTLVPTSDTNNQPFYAAWSPGDSAYQTELHSQVLEPRAWAHLLFVWTSRAAPIFSCDLYSGVRLGISYDWQRRKEPGIEIRNLWIRACGPFGVTGYRPGKYSSATPIPQTWLDRYGPGSLHLHEFTVPSPTISSEIVTDSPLLVLSANAKRTMLRDPSFSLKLIFPWLMAEECAFSQMRKRESDGSTVILLQQCDDASDESFSPPAERWHSQPGLIYLAMGNLDFTPKHTGLLEYDITAPAGRGSVQKPAVQYARTRVDLIARDPALPRQATVLDPFPACARDQLRIDSLPPIISTPVKTFRAYDATNISVQACSLAGVPRTRGLNDNDAYQPFQPPVCPNCENEFFMPRSNGRIDLNQGQTAHLLAGTTSDGTGHCSTPVLEFSLNPDASITEPLNTRPLAKDIEQSATVPFEGYDCISLDVSAWRQGPYDGDPLNQHQPKPAEQSSKPTIPSECNKPDLLAHGQPYPIQGTHDPEYALSMEQHQFVQGEPIPLYIWTNNSSDHAIELGGCREPAFFRAGGYVLYDAYGHRILNERQIAIDKQCKADPSGYYEPLVCTATVSWSLQAHTCMASSFDLTKLYDLPPGEYTISTRDPGDTASCPRRGEKPYKPDPATDIRLSVSPP